MSGLLKSFISLFIYKEPKNQELGFELLEDQNEGIEQQETQPVTANSPQKNNTKKEKNNIKNTPLTVEEWNKKGKFRMILPASL